MSTNELTQMHAIPGHGCSAQEWLTDDAEPSWQSRVIVSLLRRLPIKKRLASAAAVQDQVRKLSEQPASCEPVGLGRGVDVRLETSVQGWPLYHVAPTAQRATSDQVVFLHGGGYINEIVRAHWRLVAFMARRAGVRCIVPIFPLAPRGTAQDLVPATGELLRTIMEAAGAAKVTVVGNSAGAALGLAAAQWLRNAGHRQPGALVMISPGADFSISRREQVLLAARDPVLDIPGLREAGRLYAGQLKVSHPYVSPLNGDFHGLAPMTIFSGTLDLLFPDCIALAAKARAAGVAVELHLRKDQPHNYAVMPTPEGRQAREIILRVLASK